MKYKLYAVIVTYNGESWINKCINSLINSEIKLEIIVIDNNSTDNTVKYIKEEFPDVILIETKQNLGFAKANNIGIKYALDHNADYVFLLNQDAWVNIDTITNLLKVFEEEKGAGIVSPLLLNGNGNLFDDFFVTCLPNEYVSELYFNKLKKYYEAEFVNAAAWLISADCIRNVGGFDTLLFKHYGEDNNYCQRVKYHNYKILVSSDAVIYHDRLPRSKNYTEENEFGSFNKDRTEKMVLGNVLKDYNFDSILSDREKLKWRYFLTLRFKKYNKVKEQISLYRSILKSRNINKNIGLNWL